MHVRSNSLYELEEDAYETILLYSPTAYYQLKITPRNMVAVEL